MTGISTGGTAIRRAAPDDLWAIRDILSDRDGRSWSDDQTEWFVFGLDGRRCLGWIAWDGAKPVGLTTLFLRQMLVGQEPRPAGYWANLYLLPGYRGQMLYPRLPLVMLAGARDAGLAFVYAPIRAPDVAEAHLRLGFVGLGQMAVLWKPLRPARLTVKHFGGGGFLAAATSPLDAAYGGYLALRRPSTREEIVTESAAWSAEVATELVESLKCRPSHQVWSPESLRYRYRNTREGTRYYVLVSRRTREMAAAVIFRTAERGNRIRVGVVMDLIGRDEDPLPLRLALAEAERQATSLGCEAMIHLDGLGPMLRETLRAAGYRPSREVYRMLIWPKTAAPPGTLLADLSNWRFSFADHDAF